VDRLAVDELDRALIDQLRIDGRMSFTDIARKLGISEATARARYTRLVDFGVLEVVAIADPTKLGQTDVRLILDVRGAGAEPVARKLAEHPEVRFVATVVGGADIVLDVRGDSPQELAEIIDGSIRRVSGVERARSVVTLEVLKDSYPWDALRPRWPPSGSRRAAGAEPTAEPEV
jgi:Lrp/AsnC family transcriptional regulator for asnA, asnC and gidA